MNKRQPGIFVVIALSILMVLGFAPSVASADTTWSPMALTMGSQSGYMYEGETNAVATFPVDAWWTSDLWENDWHLVVVWDGVFAPTGITVPDVTLVWPSNIFDTTTTTLIIRGDSAGSIKAGSYGFTVTALDLTLPPAQPVPFPHGTLVIEPPDNPPVANDKAVQTNEDAWVGFNLTGSDPDAGDTLTYHIVSWPAHGTLSGTAPTVLYGPDSHFVGTDSFTFKVRDNHNVYSGLATVTITVDAVNHPPVAVAGDDQVVEANAIGSATGIVLDGSGSSDPDGDALTYEWTWAGGAASGRSPTVALPLGRTDVTLTVSDGAYSATDVVRIRVVDTTPPNIVAPADVEVVANTAGGYSGAIGMAVASDVCDAAVAISNNAPSVFHLGDTVVVWTATDDAGNTSSASQTVSVVPLSVVIDIKPGNAANNVNLRARGVIAVAILTTGAFDAASVLPSSVHFAGASPLRWAMRDVDSDGDMDLFLQFRIEDLALSRSASEAVLTGTTLTLIPIEGRDSVTIVP